MIICGINAAHGDASAALVIDGELVAAVAEERLTRVRHWAGFPARSIMTCLATAGVRATEVDAFAIARNPRANLVPKVLAGVRYRPARTLLDAWRSGRRRVSTTADRIAATLALPPEWVRRRLHRVEHHPAHLASAFFVSPFDESAVCAIDGFGDGVSTSLGLGRTGRLRIDRRVHFPHSLGLVYLALTQYLGFPRYGDEYKVMGLAAFGEPDYASRIRELIRLAPDGTFTLDLSYFRHATDGIDMTWDDGEPIIGPVFTPKLEALLGPARRPGDALEPRHEALAASLQHVFEETVFGLLEALRRRTGLRKLCLAGGCALNSVMNGRIRTRTGFEDVYVPPAAGDDGTAVGAAFHVWHVTLRQPRRFVMDHAAWGPAFGESAIQASIDDRLDDLSRPPCEVRLFQDDDALCRWTAERLADGEIVGWFQGRMEWGARALGQRSILADPRRPEMRARINDRIKFREPFRPFAPSIKEEALDDYFVGASADPFMTQVYPVRPDRRALVPAVTHVDGSGRLHTVSRRAAPLYHQLIEAFEKLTGVPVVLNTSFNESEPIVHSPAEALDCFLRTQMDALVLGRVAIAKPHGNGATRASAARLPRGA